MRVQRSCIQNTTKSLTKSVTTKYDGAFTPNATGRRDSIKSQRTDALKARRFWCEHGLRREKTAGGRGGGDEIRRTGVRGGGTPTGGLNLSSEFPPGVIFRFMIPIMTILEMKRCVCGGGWGDEGEDDDDDDDDDGHPV